MLSYKHIRTCIFQGCTYLPRTLLLRQFYEISHFDVVYQADNSILLFWFSVFSDIIGSNKLIVLL